MKASYQNVLSQVQKALALAGGASPKTMIERVSHHTPSHQPNASKQYVRQRSFQVYTCHFPVVWLDAGIVEQRESVVLIYNAADF